MKHFPFFLFSAIVLTSCKAWDASMITATKAPISPKLLTMERRMEDLANTTVVSSDDELKLFTSEVEDNLMDPYGPKYGYIAFKRNVIDLRLGMGQAVLSGLLLTVPNLLGFPFATVRYKVEVELRILDRGNQMIGKYTAIGESKVQSAYYYGYSLSNAGRKAYSDALNDAFAKIRPQIQADATRINDRLMEAGKL